MYFVYADYSNVTKQCGAVKLIYLLDLKELRAWMKREGFTDYTSYCIRHTADRFAERYLLGDFATAYDACMFSKRIKRYAKGGYIDYITRFACDYERMIRQRALRASRKLHGGRLAWSKSQATAEQLAEGAGRG